MVKRLVWGLLLSASICWSQETKKYESFEASYFYGSIFQHNKDVAHLITGHPEGFILSYNRRTYGQHLWEQLYNYPDWGFSFSYQNLKNKALGHNFGVYAHYSFYFFNRHIQAKVGQGIALTTNPFDIQDNFKNNAFGTRIMSSTMVQVGFDFPRIYRGLGIDAGASLVHYSNANIKSPNTSTNTLAFYLGLQYDLNYKDFPEYIEQSETQDYSQPIALNLVLRGGINESDYVGLGQHPFVVISAYADKRLNYKSSLQLGVDVFFSTFLQKEIEYITVAFPRRGLDSDTDYKRLGVFLGHELRFGRAALVTQLGYYLYYPYDFEGRFYQRIGIKRYFGESFFATATLKAHGAKAEAIEFGFGIRFKKL